MTRIAHPTPAVLRPGATRRVLALLGESVADAAALALIWMRTDDHADTEPAEGDAARALTVVGQGGGVGSAAGAAELSRTLRP